jgi:AmmeMemoRadiSam system protein A
MLALDEDELLRRVQELGISMCGYAPTVSLISAVRELGVGETELVKYQTSAVASGDYSSVVGYAGVIMLGMSPLVRLARETVESYIKDGKVPQVKELAPEMRGRAGVFVSIHKFGELRGCIGTFEPVEENVARETIANAITSATRDPRFLPISPEELENLSYSVDVLTHPEPAESRDQLDSERYGIIVEHGSRRGLLLPNLEGVDSVEEQIAICRQKAGISPDEPVKLYRFEVKRYK